MYADESGDPGLLHSPAPYFVLSGIIRIPPILFSSRRLIVQRFFSISISSQTIT
jgi:hypothetical protein